MTKLKILIILSLLFILAGCKKNEVKSDWLAKVNNHTISQHEFRLFYELDPNFGIDSCGLPALKAELDKMIDQHLALNMAEGKGLMEDPDIQRAIQWEKRQAVLRAFYEKKIGQNIHIDEHELRKAYLQRNEKVYLRHLFTKNKEQAEEWFGALKSDTSLFKLFASQAFKDSILARNGGNLGWVRLADLDEAFAKGIDTLIPGEISRPIRTRWGYHVVQIINRKKPAIIREDDFLKQRPMLEKWLRRQKGLALSKKFISQTIGRLNPQPDRALFLKMWLVIKDHLNLENMKLNSSQLLTNPLLNRIRNALQNDLDSPFIHAKDGSVSLEEFLSLLERIPITQRPRFKTPKELSLQLAKIFRDNYLYEQAIEEGLDSYPAVLQELQRFKENQLYYYFVNEIVDTMKVPMSVKNFFKAKEKKALDQIPKLKRFHTLQEWQFYKAEQILHHRLRQSEPVIELNLQKLEEENKRIDWDRRIRMFMIRKPS